MNFGKIVLAILITLVIFGSAAFAAGQLTTNKMTVAGKERTYLIYLPDGYSPSKTYPLVFMFHGMGSDANFAASDYHSIRDLADKKGFIAVFPDSLKDLPPKNFNLGFINIPEYDVLPIAGKTARWDIAHIQASDKYNTQDTDFVKAMISTMKSNYKISNEHVYFVGHSYGALFAYYASMSMPDKVTAFAGHSGGLVKYFIYYFPIAPRDAKSNTALAVPGLLLHSTSDGVVPYSWDQTLKNELTAKGHPNELVTLSITADGGHAWDKTKNEYIWNWLVAHSPALPTDPIQPACNANSDCGTDGFVGSQVCSNGDVYQEYKAYTCSNAGTAQAACSASSTNKLVKDCTSNEVCESAQCKVVKCSKSSDCGTDGYVGALFCKNGDVYRQYDSWTCQNPGAATASCSKQTTDKLTQDCVATQPCSNGECKNFACSANSDCGADQITKEYCSNNAVFRDAKKYQCLNPNTINAQCTNKIETTTLQQCSAKQVCDNAVCKNVACFASTDCGTNGFTGSQMCSNGDVYQPYVTYTCNNAGAVGASCSSSTTNKLVKDCISNEVCEAAQCKKVKCFANSDCGADQIFSKYCSQNAVLQDTKKFQCLNPGTAQAQCTNKTQTETLAQCSAKQLCENAECKDVVCFANTDCGADEVSAAYCSQNTILQDTKKYQCKNAGTVSAVCTSTKQIDLVKQCADKQVCDNAACKDVVCFSNIECGTNEFIGEEFCKDGSVHQNYKEYACSSAGTINAVCGATEQQTFKESCAYGCANGACNPKPSPWKVRFLVLSTDAPTMIWKNYETGTWSAQFDGGNGLLKFSFPQYAGYDIKEVETEQAGSKYWWGLWTHTGNNAGLYRQDASGGSNIIKMTWAGQAGQAKSMGLVNGDPLVLYQFTGSAAMVVKYTKTTGNAVLYKLIGTPNSAGAWIAKDIATDNYAAASAKVLWGKPGAIEIWNLEPNTFAKTSVFSVTAPIGYEAKDIETNAGKIFLLWVNENGQGKIWRTDAAGIVEKTFDVNVEFGWTAKDIELRSDGKISLLFEAGPGVAKLVVLNQDGAIESSKNYIGG